MTEVANEENQAAEEKPRVTLRELNRQYSPDRNPLIEPTTVTTKKRYVRASLAKEFVDTATGEIGAVSVISRVEERDDAEFVKVFAEGVRAMYGLSKTGMRIFQFVLTEYQEARMTGGFADSIYLHWFDGGLNGRALGISERTFHNGFKELLLNKFLAPRSANLYWVNPALFFKGDRVAFIREYKRNSPVTSAPAKENIEDQKPAD